MPVPPRPSQVNPINSNRGRLAARDTPAELDTLLVANRRAERRRRLLLIGGGLIVIALAGYGLRARQQHLPPPIRYATVVAARGALTVNVTATGTLQPVTQVEVGTEVSGTVEAVLVNFNDRVEAGQVIARLDTTQLAAKERQSHAALRLAQARVVEAQATELETRNKLRRSERLLAQKLVASEEHDTALAANTRAKAGMAVADAQVKQARAQLDYDQRLLEKAVIHAPISGIVLKRQVEPGQTVVAAMQTPVLFTLAENLKQMQLHVQVDEADVGKVTLGQSAEFTVDAYPNKKFPAVITLIRFVPQTVDGVVTYETLLTVDNSALLLRPGMTVTAEITVKKSDDVLLVPNAALRFAPPTRVTEAAAQNSSLASRLMWRPPPVTKRALDEPSAGTRVWTLRGNEPLALNVTTGASDGAQTEIVSGSLKVGTAVIVDAQTPPP